MLKKVSLPALLFFFGLIVGCAHETPNAPTPDPRHPASEQKLLSYDYVFEGGPAENLHRCGGNDGMAKLVRHYDGLYLEITQMDCKSWVSSVGNYQANRNDATSDLKNNVNTLEGTPNNFHKNILVDESQPGLHEVVIGSADYIKDFRSQQSSQPLAMAVDAPNVMARESNRKGDVIRFYIPAKPTLLDLTYTATMKTDLRSCGGTVQATVGRDGRVSVTPNGVSRCYKFDILEANYSALDYPSRFLRHDNADGLRDTFYIPSDVIQSGHNRIVLRIYNDFGNEDRVLLQFRGAY